MQISNIYVENFGKLHHFSLDLNPGLNQLCQENGFGKTTLSVFLGVMLFGFEGERKRTALENQRKRYAPWQGGAYGGTVTFSHGGKEYILQRTFGTKDAKEDTFFLYDGKTKLPSKDFSENIGEEILRIDRESFFRTAFVGQLDIKTQVTSNINAKIGDLAGEMADLGDFAAVSETLGTQIVKLSPRRKTGEIAKVADRIAQLGANIQLEPAKRRVLEGLQKQKQDYARQKEELVRSQKEIQERIDETSRKKDMFNRLAKLQQQYENAVADVASAREKVSLEQAFFPGKIPDKNLVEEMGKDYQAYASIGHALREPGFGEPEQRRLASLRAYFFGGIPSDADVRRMLEKAEELKALKEKSLEEKPSARDISRRADLEEKFSYGRPEEIEAEIKKMQELQDSAKKKTEVRKEKKRQQEERSRSLEENKKAMARLEENLRQQEQLLSQAEEKGKAYRIPLLILGILLVLAGGYGLYAQLSAALFAGVLALGAVLVILSLLGKGKKKEDPTLLKFRADICDELQERKNREAELAAQIQSAEEEVRGLESEIASLKTILERFGQKTGIPLENMEEGLYGLLADHSILSDLIRAQEDYDKKGYEETLSQGWEELRVMLGAYVPAEETEQLPGILQNLPYDIADYKRLSALEEERSKQKNRQEKLWEKLADFFTGHGFSVPEEDAVSADLNRIRDALTELFNDTKDLAEKEQAVKTLEASSGFGDIAKVQALQEELDGRSIEEYNRQSRTLQEEAEGLTTALNAIGGQIGDVEEELDQIEEDKEEQRRLSERMTALSHRMEILEKTLTLLTEAKNTMTTRYMAPFEKAFYRYYNLIDKTGRKYIIDAELKVSAQEQGSARELGFLSTGYQDLVALCSRMAMLDCMYPQEKPTVIMDDPFVNLDREKYQGAMEFLQEAARDYQILYFSCRN